MRIDKGIIGCSRQKLYVFTVLFLIAFLPLAKSAEVGGAKGSIDWPDEWVVFAPFVRDHPVPEAECLRTIPDDIQVPGVKGVAPQTAKGRRVNVNPGEPFDLAEFFKEKNVGNTAYVFLELDSPREQVVTIGMGADYWLQAWLNGKEVMNTLGTGNKNKSFPPSVLDFQADVRLRKGRNILAVRLISGIASATLALGGPAEIESTAIEAERRAASNLNVLPEKFEDRTVFPVEEQAVIMARRGLNLPETDADLSQGALAGVRNMPKRQMFFDKRERKCRDTLSRRFDDPVKIRLSKYRYPWEDRHLDAIVWTTPPKEGSDPEGRIEVILKGAAGTVLARHDIDKLSPNGLFFSVGFPKELKGEKGALEVVWRQGDKEIGRAESPFQVQVANDSPRAGRIPLRILNKPGARLRNAPFTVGVPFPRGALNNEANVRLVDESGTEIPLQTKVTAKWSRFGPVKWLLCDFTLDLSGEPRQVHLEYGPDVSRTSRPAMASGKLPGGLPELNAGRLRISADGLDVDPKGAGAWRTALTPQAMLGGFVRHADGATYSMPADSEYAFEELGGEKAVLRRTGWYVNETSGAKFCQFVTRFVFHRNSPVVRIFHTWIYTGDDKKDRIADMGWRFDGAGAVDRGKFLESFESGEWISGESLVQFDYKKFLLPDSGVEKTGRSPGVLSVSIGDTCLTFGAKDFWQNFPSELEIGDKSFSFYNWPRHNPPARFKRPVAPGDAFRHRFAHEGEVLDFRLPDEYTQGEIWSVACRREGHWAEGRPETANAQGIARTEEMFLFFADGSVSADESAKVIQGLNDETLRAVVDPAWVCASGAFGDIHPEDRKKYPEIERLYTLTVGSPARWVERLGFYGMWLHGDYAAWNLNLERRYVSNYRTLRKAHHAFPYRWIPFARTGDPQFLKLAENAARQMVDANFCHYATEDVDRAVGPRHFRRQGWWDRSLLPWASRMGPFLRTYTIDCDYLWNTHYMTGFRRVLDVALLFGELTKQDYKVPDRSRGGNAILRSYLNMYKATFDPWFLNAFHETADMHVRYYGRDDVDRLMPEHPRNVTGFDHWRAADQELYAFTGSDTHRQLARNSAVSYSNPRMVVHRAGAGSEGGVEYSRHAVYSWKLTGDPFYLRRCAAVLDCLKYSSYEGEIDWMLGAKPGGFGSEPLRLARAVPMAMAALDQLDKLPDPLHDVICLSSSEIPEDDVEDEYKRRYPDVFIRHEKGSSFKLLFDSRAQKHRKLHLRYDIRGPEGKETSGETQTPSRVDIEGGPGTYRITTRVIEKSSKLFFPVTKPGVPEVLRFEPSPEGTSVQSGQLGYWFFVPEGVEKFWIDFTVRPTPRQHVNRVSVWDPEGQRAWDRSYHGDSPERVEVTVPPGQDGKLWRATGGSFIIDPKIPPYFSLSRMKWFNPQNNKFSGKAQK